MAIKDLMYKDHNEWLAIRNKFIGGSDASAVLGTNPYRSTYTLWAEKTGKIPSFEGNLITECGTYLEEFVAKQFEKATGKKVRRKNRTMVNDLYPFACANVDRLIVGEDAGLECKTTNNFLTMRQCKSGAFPDIYYAQCVHYLAVTGKKKWYLAVLLECREFKVFELERDDAECEALMKAEAEFWNLVETNTPPSIDGTESSAESLRLIYPESTSDVADLFAYESNLRQYVALGKQIDELKAMREEQANIIKEYMKDAGNGVTSGYKVSYSAYEKKSFDVKSFSADHPQMNLDGYYKTSSVRTFKVTEKIIN